MTGPDVNGAPVVGMTDMETETAILSLLTERVEIYPAFMIGELRRLHPHLSPERIRQVLERLWTERRVARLWHRYMLPGDVDAVRTKWLSTLSRNRAEFERMDPSEGAYEDGIAILNAWDGWSIGNEKA
jgi:hypothetical protein